MEKYCEYSVDNTAKKRRIDLSTNYRSRLEVIDSVNAVFERVKYNDGPFSTISRQKEQGTFYLELNDFLRNVKTIYYNSNQAVTA